MTVSTANSITDYRGEGVFPCPAHVLDKSPSQNADRLLPSNAEALAVSSYG
jgi:hypothetical protein